MQLVVQARLDLPARQDLKDQRERQEDQVARALSGLPVVLDSVVCRALSETQVSLDSRV